MQRNDEEERSGVTEAGEEREGGEEGDAVAEIPAEVALTLQELPTTISVTIPSSTLQGAESSVSHDVELSPDVFTGDRVPTISSPTLSISTVSDLTPTEFDEDICEDIGERIFTRHETFYLEDGNVEIACGQTIFRVHSTVVSFSSPNLRDMLSSSTLLNASMPEGCPRVVFKDSAQDFAVLLKMIYIPGWVFSPRSRFCKLTRLLANRFLVARNKVREFTVFASLLRMTTKYGFSDIREALIEDLKGAYPTKWEDFEDGFEAANVLGEEIFGLPKPHPNAVLKLFLEQRIKFALPFAAYRAGLGGPSALASEGPSTVLPRLTITSIIHGMGGMRRAMTSIAYTWELGACSERACLLNVGVNPTERRVETLKISDAMVRANEGDMLSSLSLGNPLCMDCAGRLEDIHRDCRKKLVWAKLPSLLGWESWEGAV